MSDTITRLNLGGREYVLVGTAHVSAESVTEVIQTIEAERPDRVCVELDEGRYRSLSEAQDWSKLDIFKVIKDGKGFLLMANLALSTFQKRMGESLESKPGMEMKAAIDKSNELGIPFSNIDREIAVTLRRAWAKSSFWNKNKLLAVLISSAFGDEKIDKDDIEKLKQRNELDGMMAEMARDLPTVKKVLIDERDQFLATRLFESQGTKVVAVVGAGHVPGMIQWLNNLHSGAAVADTTEIGQVPPPGLWSKIWPWVIPGLIVGLLVGGFFLKGFDSFVQTFSTWALWTGLSAAVGTLLALGHPLTILTAAVAAPFTTLHPLLGVGMFTGLVEAFFRKPRVSDFENLNSDLSSLRGMYRNRITRILLVFVLSSLGAAAAFWVNLPTLVGSLVK